MFPLLATCSLGFREIEKVDILWSDRSNTSKATRDSSGELYLKVSMSGDSGVKSYWSTLMNDCLRIMDLIDWSRSHPENVNEFCSVYGIDSGWKFFLNVIPFSWCIFSLDLCKLLYTYNKCNLSSTAEFGVSSI